jgi:type II secretory pathway component PulF
MREYVWKARNLKGEIQGGTITARHERDVIGQLRRRRMIVLSIRQKSREVALPTLGTGVKARDIVVFSRQFATMINSGLPLIQCLEILSTQVESKNLGRVLQEVGSDVQAGNSLSDSLAKHMKVFSPLFINMIAAGEAGGSDGLSPGLRHPDVRPALRVIGTRPAAPDPDRDRPQQFPDEFLALDPDVSRHPDLRHQKVLQDG